MAPIVIGGEVVCGHGAPYVNISCTQQPRGARLWFNRVSSDEIGRVDPSADFPGLPCDFRVTPVHSAIVGVCLRG